jgi:lysozyme family protein
MNYGDKWPTYAKEWDTMTINPSRQKEFDKLAQSAIDHKPRYQAIEAKTGVPWPLIAVLHRRESDADFNTYLGNGDPLNRRTTHVPAGRGPFASFEDGAVDALHLDGLDKIMDWRLEKMLFYCEVFNGAGYSNRGLPSPYVWGGTNIQKPGKYVADGQWSSTTMDGQPGCAPILATIAKLDPSVKFTRESAGAPQSSPAKPPHDASWPPPPYWPPLVTNDDRAKIFGRFSYVAAPTGDNPEAIRVTDGWDTKNIVNVPIPQMAKRGLGSGMPFHRLGAAQLQLMWKQWEDAGLLDRVLEFDGSYAPRFVRGSSSSLSNHAFGCAFDINYEWNQLGVTPALAGDKGSVRELVPIANECGFFWGGHYAGRKDGMHFELTRVDAGGIALPVHDLVWAQVGLNKLGASPPLIADGLTGPKTQAALKAFQAKVGIVADGKYGPQTQAALEKALTAPVLTPRPTGNPFLGKSYHYLIGTDGNLAGEDNVVTEPGYDATQPPAKGVGVAYGNCFDEKQTGRYAPYKNDSDTAKKYGEGEIDAKGAGWHQNLQDQLVRRKGEGWHFIEWDNPDAYRSADVLGAVALAESYAIGVVAKNAKLCEGAVQYLAHPNVYAHVVEKGAGNPMEIHALRMAAGKPTQPTVFVFFGNTRALAQQYAGQIKAGSYPEMRVTWSASGEYGSSEEIT